MDSHIILVIRRLPRGKNGSYHGVNQMFFHSLVHTCQPTAQEDWNLYRKVSFLFWPILANVFTPAAWFISESHIIAFKITWGEPMWWVWGPREQNYIILHHPHLVAGGNHRRHLESLYLHLKTYIFELPRHFPFQRYHFHANNTRAHEKLKNRVWLPY